MAEPISSSTAAGVTGAAAWKAAGGAAGVAAFGATMAAVVVMGMTVPKDRDEWIVALISTVISSLSIGSYVAMKAGLPEVMAIAATVGKDAEMMMLLAQFGGIIFACGLPGWFLVRAVFQWMHNRNSLDIQQVIAEVKNGAAADS